MPTRSPRPLRLAPRHKVWVLCDGAFLMGPNYLRFLRAVDETGAIREGGKAVGWSYRTCLNRVRRMERALGRPVLLTARVETVRVVLVEPTGAPGSAPRPGACSTGSSGGMPPFRTSPASRSPATSAEPVR